MTDITNEMVTIKEFVVMLHRNNIAGLGEFSLQELTDLKSVMERLHAAGFVTDDELQKVTPQGVRNES